MESSEYPDGPRPGAASREAASKGAHDRVYRLLRDAVSSGRVLDIPCGSGAFTRRLAESGYSVSAVDLERHPALPDVDFRPADMNQPLPFEDETFDGIVSIEGIEHIERPFDFVRECRRLLRPGGTIILTTPNISSIRSRWRWFLTGFHNKAKYPLDERHPAARHHINMLSYPAVRYMLHTNGFHIESVATNRVKAASWIYAPVVLVQYAVSKWALRRGAKNENHRGQIHEIVGHMLGVPVAFGETLIVVARAETVST